MRLTDWQRYQSDPMHYVKKIYRERGRFAKMRGIPFNLALSDLPPVPTLCPALGIPLKHGGTNNPNSPSLDRLIPERGYVKGNVYWLSRRANGIKHNADLREIENVAHWFRQQLRKTSPMRGLWFFRCKQFVRRWSYILLRMQHSPECGRGRGSLKTA